MKLNRNEKALLLKWGHPKSDLPQIEKALQKSITNYKCNGTTISREEAIQILGKTVFLSGISRSAFHFTAMRQNNEGKSVYFDSSRLFK